MLNEGSACQNFVLGTFNASASKFVPAAPPQPRVAAAGGSHPLFFSRGGAFFFSGAG